MNETKKKTKTTINHVAREAGVSTTTISRYLNGKYEYMSSETREIIRKVIDELGYRPSNIARSLKAKKSGTVGCVIADITNPFSSYLVKGINDVFRKNGYQVLFANTDNNPENEVESIKSLLDSQLDGLIVNTTGYIDDYLLELSNHGLPIVMADRCLKNKFLLDTITTDNYNSTFECMKFLSKQGYDKVAFLTQELGNNSSRYIRHNAYLDAMAKIYGTDGNLDTYLVDIHDIRVCKTHLKLLKENNSDKEIALFAVNGVTLLNILHTMQDEGLVVAKDFGVCGFDDWEWASLIEPGITTITQNSYLTGTKSAQLLLKRMSGENDSKKTYTEIPPTLVARGSTTPYRNGTKK